MPRNNKTSMGERKKKRRTNGGKMARPGSRTQSRTTNR